MRFAIAAEDCMFLARLDSATYMDGVFVATLVPDTHSPADWAVLVLSVLASILIRNQVTIYSRMGHAIPDHHYVFLTGIDPASLDTGSHLLWLHLRR